MLSRGACLPTPSSTVAAHELALFLCQGGGGGELATRAASGGAEPACSPRTQAEADRLLASLGFGFRLAPQVCTAAALRWWWRPVRACWWLYFLHGHDLEALSLSLEALSRCSTACALSYMSSLRF